MTQLAPLPERDPALTNRAQGVYRKFDVRRTDGSSEPGGKHHGCEYFVLDVTHDPHARAALAAYATAVESTHPALAADMRERYGLAARDSRDIDALVTRFLTWPLPGDVAVDPCAMALDYPGRSGTNLLTAGQAKAMLQHILGGGGGGPRIKV